MVKHTNGNSCAPVPKSQLAVKGNAYGSNVGTPGPADVLR